MKIPKSFKIATAQTKSCRQGGSNHNTRRLTDGFGRTLAYECVDCGHKTVVKQRKHKVTSKIVL